LKPFGSGKIQVRAAARTRAHLLGESENTSAPVVGCSFSLAVAIAVTVAVRAVGCATRDKKIFHLSDNLLLLAAGQVGGRFKKLLHLAGWS